MIGDGGAILSPEFAEKYIWVTNWNTKTFTY